jgi:hypothetical protein
MVTKDAIFGIWGASGGIDGSHVCLHAAQHTGKKILREDQPAVRPESD